MSVPACNHFRHKEKASVEKEDSGSDTDFEEFPDTADQGFIHATGLQHSVV